MWSGASYRSARPVVTSVTDGRCLGCSVQAVSPAVKGGRRNAPVQLQAQVYTPTRGSPLSSSLCRVSGRQTSHCGPRARALPSRLLLCLQVSHRSDHTLHPLRRSGKTLP